jgi:hypothetical protein
MSYPAGTLGTLMELYEQEVGEFVGYLRGLGEGLAVSTVINEETVSVRGILRHVTESGYAYAAYARGAIKGQGITVPVEVPAFADPVEGVAAVVGRMAEALRGSWEMTDAQIEAAVAETYWGTRYNLEQILEHAIVHVLWHRRQVGRVVRMARESSV